jgi:hypothetical protein
MMAELEFELFGLFDRNWGFGRTVSGRVQIDLTFQVDTIKIHTVEIVGKQLWVLALEVSRLVDLAVKPALRACCVEEVGTFGHDICVKGKRALVRHVSHDDIEVFCEIAPVVVGWLLFFSDGFVRRHGHQ